jgi:hypothetical protein
MCAREHEAWRRLLELSCIEPGGARRSFGSSGSQASQIVDLDDGDASVKKGGTLDGDALLKVLDDAIARGAPDS